MNDDLIQQLLDEGGELKKGTNPDIDSYQTLYNFLDNQESFVPSPGFAHRVSASIDLQHKQKSFGILVPLLLGILVFTCAGIALVVYFKISIDLSGATPMLLIMFILALGLIGVYRIIERKLLKTS